MRSCRAYLYVAAALALIVFSLPLAGCITRHYVIETRPSNARVVINGEDAGRSPIVRPFMHYGTSEFIISHEGHQRLKVWQEIEPPWYQIFPIDFVVEMIWPWQVEELEVFVYELEPVGDLDSAGLLERAEEMKDRMESLGGGY